MTSANYELHCGAEGQARLGQIGAIIDDESIGYVEALGIGQGWSVLDLGAGGGSMTGWFCRRVGASGRVVAIDLDTQNVDRLSHPNLEVRRAHIVAHNLERESFDLIFARVVLVHIPEREAVLDKLVAALRPGGWILGMDLSQRGVAVDADTPIALAARHAWLDAVIGAAAPRAGREIDTGPRWPARLRARGLIDVGADVRQPYFRGASETALFWQRTRRNGLALMVQSGDIANEDLEAALAIYDDPRLGVWDTPKVYAWGRKPS